MSRSLLLLLLLPVTASAALTDHVYGGLPTSDAVIERQGYVLAYDEDYRVPTWVGYKVTRDARRTPPRAGKFKSFRTDPDVNHPVKDGDYVGLHASRGYARGHLAPYGVMGGDRDGDGQTAADGDAHDERTVFEANYMSNIAPQHHAGFNGSPGLWYQLERYIQDRLVSHHGKTVWIHAGSVFGYGETEVVGPDNDIYVPPMFYKIVVLDEFTRAQPKVLAFLFPHQRVSHGNIEHFLVSIDVIEAMTGLDFFPNLPDSDEERIEDVDTWTHWQQYFLTLQ